MSNIDPDGFIEEVIRKDIVPLAFKPLTLHFLIDAFAKDKALPASRAELYFQGCRRLCEEADEGRRDSLKGRGSLSTGQRLTVAASIGAVTQLSNRSAVQTGLDEGLEPEDVSLESATGTAVLISGQGR